MVLEERDGKNCRVDKQEVQVQLKDLQDQASEQETAADQAKADYFTKLIRNGIDLTPAGRPPS